MTTKEKADALVEKHQQATSLGLSKLGATKHAIIDIENTINSLELARKNQQIALYWIDEVIDWQTEILTQLKSRL